MDRKKTVDWKFTNSAARKLLRSLSVTDFPIQILDLISRRSDTKVYSYEEFSKLSGSSIEEIISKVTKSKLAGTLQYGNKFYILYNDDFLLYTPQMIRYTLAHELGHIVLNHFESDATLLSRGGLTDTEYDCLEKEADTFAAELLAPIELISPSWDAKYTASLFNISKEAADIKFRSLQKYPWLYGYNGFKESSATYCCHMHDHTVFKEPLINNHFYLVLELPNYAFCECCHSVVSMYKNENMKFCSVCGKQLSFLFPGEHCFKFYERCEANMIDYKVLALDKNGKAKECPRCGADTSSNEGDFCEICNAYLINRCSGESQFEKKYEEGLSNYEISRLRSCQHGNVLSGRARYCPYCGSISTFYLQGLLEDYPAEYKAEKEKSNNSLKILNPFNKTESLVSDNLPF